MKANGPVKSLSGLAAKFQSHVEKMQGILAALGARLLPTAMHPWMQPERELRLWPHENDVIYQTFDRIFDCRGHGWSNLQSMHINLPFQGDDELGRLHAAMRLILPILPALAASSPFVEGEATGFCDTRVDVYRTNARRVPSVSGVVIPEPVFTRADYEGKLLQKIYDDMAALDPEGVLRHEWVNARGCIARFERMAIEIRLLDLQECPRADLAIAHLVVSALKRLVAEQFGSYAEQKAFGESELSALLTATVKDGDEAVLDHPSYLAALGYPKSGRVRARDVWQHLAERVASDAASAEWRPALEVILGQGCLSDSRQDGYIPQPRSARGSVSGVGGLSR
jgi:gamma-glutamyl:cysteine ligase YbdK (ATP-grasp superfamily)